MKRLPGLIAICMIVLLISCGSGPAKDDTKAADTTAAVAPPPAEVKPVFVPFKVINIQHKVKNFEKWEEAYLSHDSVRKTYGITHWMIGRDLKDSNLVYIVDKMEDLAKAQTFSKLPNLKDAMKKAGVTSAPGFSYAEVIRSDDSAVESSDRVSVAHHVKDFSTWLKAFDAEGAASRANNGLVDRLLARSLVDSNMIYIVFAVTDMTKAKARVGSPELKKIMTDAGVDSPPTIRWYRLVK
jgi:quinol monooxygenase YgiN